MGTIKALLAALSVLVAYYFGRKSRSDQLRSSVYEKQIELALEYNELVNDIERSQEEIKRQVHGKELKSDQSQERKKQLLKCMKEAGENVMRIIRAEARCSLIMSPRLMKKIHEVGSKAATTVHLSSDPWSSEAEVQEAKTDLTEARSQFRGAFREEFGVEELSDETKRVLKELDPSAESQKESLQSHVWASTESEKPD